MPASVYSGEATEPTPTEQVPVMLRPEDGGRDGFGLWPTASGRARSAPLARAQGRTQQVEVPQVDTGRTTLTRRRRLVCLRPADGVRGGPSDSYRSFLRARAHHLALVDENISIVVCPSVGGAFRAGAAYVPLGM